MASPRSLDLQVGEQVGKFQIERKLATGGMAEVYLARSFGVGRFEKRVVLKRIRPELVQDAEFVDMFLDEARLAATLQHPNIAQVYDVRESDGSVVIVMEYVDGIDARFLIGTTRAKGATVPIEHIVTIGIGIAGALHHAHEACAADGHALELVHRDVSPSNVMISRDGGVKLIDFGIAKGVARLAHTRNRVIKGKWNYLAPEQLLARPIDRRTDVFAFGTLLYELAVGQRPWHDLDDDKEVAHAIVHRDVTPPNQLRADIPAALAAIVLRARHRVPARRFATARDLQIALENFAHEARIKISTLALSEYVRSLGVLRPPSRPAFAKRPEPSMIIEISTGPTVGDDETPDTDEDEAVTDEAPPRIGGLTQLATSENLTARDIQFTEIGFPVDLAALPIEPRPIPRPLPRPARGTKPPALCAVVAEPVAITLHRSRTWMWFVFAILVALTVAGGYAWLASTR